MAKRTCHDCVYAGRPPVTRSLMSFTAGWPSLLMCVNHPDTPGELRDVAPAATACRNFRIRRLPAQRITPPPPADDEVRYIGLTKGKYAIVDAADYEWLSQYTWHATCARGRYYAATVIDGKSISMHRMIMNPPPGKVTDHADANGLNNRRANLRNCTPEQNRHNTRPRSKASPYIGVTRCGNRYRAKITYQGQHIFLGSYETAIEAAKARDEKARDLFGEYAWLNFPDEHPQAGDGSP
jgi:hypothetical protein